MSYISVHAAKQNTKWYVACYCLYLGKWLSEITWLALTRGDITRIRYTLDASRTDRIGGSKNYNAERSTTTYIGNSSNTSDNL